MLNYKNTILLFAFLISALLAANFYWPVPVGVYIFVTLLFLAVIFYGSYFIHSNFFIPVLCHGNENENKVALSFDDGPLDDHTEKILDTLKNNNVQAAFFCIGKRVKNHSAIVQRMNNDGHLIGNHSYSHHFFFDLFTKAKMRFELDSTNTEIENIIHRKPLLFRPPYGVTTPNLAKVIRATGMLPVGWSLRSMDTVIKNESQLVNKIRRRLQPGDVLLLHDSSSITVNSLQQIIDTIKQKGFELVRLDQLLKIKAYA